MDEVKDVVTRWLEGLLTADEAMGQIVVAIGTDPFEEMEAISVSIKEDQ